MGGRRANKRATAFSRSEKSTYQQGTKKQKVCRRVVVCVDMSKIHKIIYPRSVSYWPLSLRSICHRPDDFFRPERNSLYVVFVAFFLSTLLSGPLFPWYPRNMLTQIVRNPMSPFQPLTLYRPPSIGRTYLPLSTASPRHAPPAMSGRELVRGYAAFIRISRWFMAY